MAENKETHQSPSLLFRAASDKHLWQRPRSPPGTLSTVTQLRPGSDPERTARMAVTGEPPEAALVPGFCGVRMLLMTRSPKVIKSTICGGFLIYFLRSNEMFDFGFNFTIDDQQ